MIARKRYWRNSWRRLITRKPHAIYGIMATVAGIFAREPA